MVLMVGQAAFGVVLARCIVIKRNGHDEVDVQKGHHRSCSRTLHIPVEPIVEPSRWALNPCSAF